MAYRTTNLVVRRANAGYSYALEGLWDDVKSFGSGVVNAFGEQKKAEGAAAAATNYATPIPGVTPGYDTGPSMGTIALIGAVGIGAVLLLKRRKK